jgi:lipopolysaccharide transport system permease protein
MKPLLYNLLNVRNHFAAIREIISLLTRHRQLTWEMSKREISDRYAGQFFGLFWAVGHPLALMTVYVFIFAYVFRMKIGGTHQLPLDYTTYLLCALIPWMAFQEIMTKSPTSITGNANLVKQVIFPIEVLPIKSVVSSLITQIILTAFLIFYVLLKHKGLLWTYVLIPIPVFFQVLAMIGMSYILSAIGAYFRDLKDFMQVFCLLGMYIMPIFYLPDQVPAIFRPFLYLNPFSYLAWCYQDVFYFGRIDHWWAWLVYMFLSIGVFYVGYRIFRKLKIMFGNVL